MRSGVSRHSVRSRFFCRMILVPRGEANEVCKSLDGNDVTIADQLAHGLPHGCYLRAALHGWASAGYLHARVFEQENAGGRLVVVDD